MDFKKLLGSVAPILGGLIGGPLGSAAGKAVGSILLPGQDNPSDNDLKLALEKATPNQISEIKKIDAEYKVNLASLEIQDRNSARNRQIAMKDKMPSFITISILLGYFGVLFLLFFDHIVPKNSEIIDLLIGSLSTVFIQSISYYFGGSVKRSIKDE